jgi:type VI secretion system secreted protein VgrG
MSDATDPGDAAALVELHLRRGERLALDVHSLRGVEALSACYQFDVVASVPRAGDALDLHETLGEYARLVLHAPGHAPRTVHAVVSAARGLGPVSDLELARYRLRLVPRLALLKLTQNSRIFQDQTVPEIVATVLRKADVRHKFTLLGAYARRGYCVQYQESDYAFITRLLAEEGIWFAFSHPVSNDGNDDGELLVLADRATHYAPIAGDLELPLQRLGGVVAEEHVARFGLERSARPGAVELRHFDYQRPNLERGAKAAIATPRRGLDEARLALYDHHAEFEDAALTRADSERALQQHRRKALRAAGESNSRRLHPARFFELTDAAPEGLDGAYVVTRVEHRARLRRLVEQGAGDGEGVYRNTFQCVPRATNAPPPRPPRRLQQGVETAIVVGPSGEAIYTDPQGRVKVQFHWDREGARNEHSSCWLRVAQAWAGAQMGAQFLPRVGTEVLVGFVGGDVDRPVVLGALHNGLHDPPFALPDQKTRSGFRTASTPGGEGFNELSFEDAAGSEEVLLRAQRDLREVVLNDRTSDVGADLTLTVAGDCVESIGASRVEVIRGGRTSTVMGDRQSHVLGDARATVERDSLRAYNASAETIVRARRTTRVGEVDEQHLAQQRVNVTGDQHTCVKGSATLQVGRPFARSAWVVHVEGFAELDGTHMARVSSERELQLVCGRSLLRMTPDQIELVAPTVRLTGEGASVVLHNGEAKVSSTDKATVVAERITLKATAASLGLDREARLGGDMVRLGVTDDASRDPEEERPPPTRIELVDQDGNPLAHQRFKLVFRDGSSRAGLLDAHGAAVIDLEENATVEFEALRDVKER